MQVPTALAAAEPEERLKSGLAALGLDDSFATIVSAEDVSRGRPDPEGYLYAAQKIGRPPVRCIVIGNSNQVQCSCALYTCQEVSLVVVPCMCPQQQVQ